jgi:cytochrome c oxidase cbb3-type subunit 3
MDMRSRILMLPVLGALLAVSCQVQPVETAPAGAASPLMAPTGPIPGGQQKPDRDMNPYAQDRVALAEGRNLFVKYNCSGCHGGHAGGGMGPSLRDEVWIYGSSDAMVYTSIAEGRANGMPAWGTRLPQEQIWKLAAYVKSLRSPLEPDKPEQ